MKRIMLYLSTLTVVACSHPELNRDPSSEHEHMHMGQTIPGAQAAPTLPPLPPKLPPLPGKGPLPPGLPGTGTLPPLPGSCLPPGTMPVTPDTCRLNTNMCGCEKYPHDPNVKPVRRRPKDRVDFPSIAPGIEAYSDLGYCTGVSTGATRVESIKGGTSFQKNVRKYTLRLKQEVEPKTGRTFLKTTMDDQADDKTDRIKKCNPLSQMEKGIASKKRPINAPPLFFVEGETAEITVFNESKKQTLSSKDILTSVHWHGIILPNDQDGIADITQAPIKPGEKKIYRFDIQQHGTYWYHPHDLNEQDTKGSIIIFPNPDDEAKNQKEFGGVTVKYHHDRLVMLTDYKERKTLKVLNYLRDEDRNAYETDSRIHKGWLNNMECAKEYLENFKMMKMFWMDQADVWYDSFFINDETCLNCGEKLSKIEKLHTEFDGQKFSRLNEFSNFKKGERVRLRIVNGSASSYFFLDYANSDALAPKEKLDMLIVAKDGLAIKPQYADQIYIGMGETYDVIVEVPEDGTLYEFRAKSIDDNNDGRMARVLIGSNPLDDRETKNVVAARNVAVQICGPYPEMKDQLKVVNYTQMEMAESKTKATPSELRPFEIYHREAPIANYSLKLSGSMEDYHWRIDGVDGTKLEKDSMHMPYMTIKEGHRIRVTIENDMVMGMMNHPWHLHGNWFRIINEKDTDDQIAKKALLHTATIFPGQKMTLEFYADPEYRGAWMFHCHNLYHMANDMMMYLRYDTIDEDHMRHMTHHHHDSLASKVLPGAISGIKNQYGVIGVGGQIGTDGMGPTAQLRYRATLGDNMGLFGFDFDIASDAKDSLKNFSIESRARYCFAVNKCVFLDFDLHRPNEGGGDGTAYVGGEYHPWNSDFVVLEAGAGSTCVENPNTKAINCSPAIKADVSSTIDAGWNTKVTGKVGCEGKYCKEFFASLNVATTPHPRLTIVPINCKISTNKEETACMAEIKIITDPIPLGRHH